MMMPMPARTVSHALRDEFARRIALEAQARRDLSAMAAAFGRLGVGLDDVDLGPAPRRLELYRAYVGLAVRSVSPLLLRLCELGGFEIDRLADDLEPGGRWLPWLCGRVPRDPSLSVKGWPRLAGVVSPERLASYDFHRFAHGGLVVRGTRHPDGALGMRVLESGLEVGALLGTARLRTDGGRATLLLRAGLPETMRAALPGRRLADLVSHPALDGGSHVIDAVEDVRRGGTRLHFRAEPMSWTFAWARWPRSDAVAPTLPRRMGAIQIVGRGWEGC